MCINYKHNSRLYLPVMTSNSVIGGTCKMANMSKDTVFLIYFKHLRYFYYFNAVCVQLKIVDNLKKMPQLRIYFAILTELQGR